MFERASFGPTSFAGPPDKYFVTINGTGSGQCPWREIVTTEEVERTGRSFRPCRQRTSSQWHHDLLGGPGPLTFSVIRARTTTGKNVISCSCDGCSQIGYNPAVLHVDGSCGLLGDAQVVSHEDQRHVLFTVKPYDQL
jgi:hypothetical protein